MNCRRILKRHSLPVFCQTCRCVFGSALENRIWFCCTLLHFSWHSLVPVVVYPDWTVWLPCGCQAAPLLCGNWCLWCCRVATVLWLTGLATCPALAANVAWKRGGGKAMGGIGTGEQGVSARHVTGENSRWAWVSSNQRWTVLKCVGQTQKNKKSTVLHKGSWEMASGFTLVIPHSKQAKRL